MRENEPMNFFASPQCIGYRIDKGRLTREMCYPSDQTILTQVNLVEFLNKKLILTRSIEIIQAQRSNSKT